MLFESLMNGIAMPETSKQSEPGLFDFDTTARLSSKESYQINTSPPAERKALMSESKQKALMEERHRRQQDAKMRMVRFENRK